MSFLEVKDVQKIYRSRFSASSTQALHSVSFALEKGEFVAVMGESGSGKSTLLNILATLDRPTKGAVILNGQDTARIPAARLAAYRRNHLGFIFQDYSLLDTFTNKDNILLPLVLNKMKPSEMGRHLAPLARQLGIEATLKKYPYEISGGQKQRIAVARALITKPDILLADEPTGALDSKSSQQLLQLLEQLNRQGQTIVMVTHSALAASYASRVLFIQDGTIYNQIFRGNASRQQFYDQIVATLSLIGQER